MVFLNCPRSSWARKLDAHPLSFSLSFHILISLEHPLHDNPYSSHWHQLMGISIARWLAASMWHFLPFCLLHTTSTIIFYSTYSATSMTHAHVLRGGWKSWSALKSMNQLLGLSSGFCMMWIFCVKKMEHSQTIWFCRDNFLWPCYFEKTWLLGQYAWSIIIFMSILNFCLESFGSEY